MSASLLIKRQERCRRKRDEGKSVRLFEMLHRGDGRILDSAKPADPRAVFFVHGVVDCRSHGQREIRAGAGRGARGAALSACRNGDIRELIVKLVASVSFRFVSESDWGSSTPEATCAQRGITDCEALTSIDGVEVSLEECVRCQGAQPGTEPSCAAFPFAGVAIIRGCCSDEDCEGLAPFCGRFTAPNGVCVQDDAI